MIQPYMVQVRKDALMLQRVQGLIRGTFMRQKMIRNGMVVGVQALARGFLTKKEFAAVKSKIEAKVIAVAPQN